MCGYKCGSDKLGDDKAKRERRFGGSLRKGSSPSWATSSLSVVRMDGNGYSLARFAAIFEAFELVLGQVVMQEIEAVT